MGFIDNHWLPVWTILLALTDAHEVGKMEPLHIIFKVASFCANMETDFNGRGLLPSHRRFWCELRESAWRPVTVCLPCPTDDCAALLLACLHCRFHEFMVLLPDTCERAVSRCFPSYRYVRWSAEGEQVEKDCCSYKLEMDCNCCGSCQETGEFMEFAMEISEVCYRWGASWKQTETVIQGFSSRFLELLHRPSAEVAKGFTFCT